MIVIGSVVYKQIYDNSISIQFHQNWMIAKQY